MILQTLLGLFVINSTSLHAESSPVAPEAMNGRQAWCEARIWPIKRDLTLEQISAEISSAPRLDVLQSGWGEIMKADPQNMVAPIFRYLSGTETNAKLRGYYEGIAYIALGEITVQEAVKIWPKRVPIVKEHFSLQEMCDFYEQIKNNNRGPNSLTAAVKKLKTKKNKR